MLAFGMTRNSVRVVRSVLLLTLAWCSLGCSKESDCIRVLDIERHAFDPGAMLIEGGPATYMYWAGAHNVEYCMEHYTTKEISYILKLKAEKYELNSVANPINVRQEMYAIEAACRSAIARLRFLLTTKIRHVDPLPLEEVWKQLMPDCLRWDKKHRECAVEALTTDAFYACH